MPDPKEALKDGSYADEKIDISLNVFELDAASNNSVEDIRRLIEQVRYQPQSGTHKVFIIDEVHMLSQSAFNAFLKTLEEPPPYALFILATTEKHKILPTILSRCQLYDFRRIQVKDIILQLEAIAKKENIKVERDALFYIAEKSDGAMRDALSLFDRIASASNNEITYRSVADNLNMLDHEYFFRSINAVISENSSELLLIYDEVLTNGFEGDIYMSGLSKHLRNLLYCKQDATQSLLQFSESLRAKYQEQATNISFSTLLTALSIANQCDLDFPKAKDKRLHVELSLLKICYSGRKSFVLESKIQSTFEEKKNQPTEIEIQDTDPLISNQITKDEVVDILDAENIEAATDTKPIERKPTPEPTLQDKLQSAESTGAGSSLLQESKRGILNTPALTSIADVLKEAQQERDKNSNEKLPLDLTLINEVWNSYAEEQDSPTTKSTLGLVKIELEQDEIKVYVPSHIAKEEIHHEVDLFSLIRTKFNRSDLRISVVTNRDKFPGYEETIKRKIHTIKEKYDFLNDKNPLLETMISSLNLKLDQD